MLQDDRMAVTDRDKTFASHYNLFCYKLPNNLMRDLSLEAKKLAQDELVLVPKCHLYGANW